jgi:quinol monooxygenase YgiN
MIVISGTIDLDPAKSGRMIELTSELSAETRKETGNLSYEYWQDPTNPGRWRVFEEWESEDAITAHMATPHMAAFMAGAAELGISGIDISRYEVTEKSKFM